MRIEHAFEYNADYYEVSDEFCANDKTKTMTHVQLLEIAEQLNDNGKWFIETLNEYMKGGE